MLRIGSYEKGVYILTAKDMKRIANSLFNTRVQIMTASDEIVCAKRYIGDNAFDSLKFANGHAKKANRIVRRVYDWLELYMLR